MSFTLLALSAIFLGFYVVLSRFKTQKKSFNFRVLSALAGGLLFGGIIQIALGTDSAVGLQFSELISVRKWLRQAAADDSDSTGVCCDDSFHHERRRHQRPLENRT